MLNRKIFRKLGPMMVGVQPFVYTCVPFRLFALKFKFGGTSVFSRQFYAYCCPYKGFFSGY